MIDANRLDLDEDLDDTKRVRESAETIGKSGKTYVEIARGER